MSVNELLDTLFEELEASKKLYVQQKAGTPISVFDLIDDIRDNLPVELERAATYKGAPPNTCRRRKGSSSISKRHSARPHSWWCETSIIKQAQQEAERIVTEAKQAPRRSVWAPRPMPMMCWRSWKTIWAAPASR